METAKRSSEPLSFEMEWSILSTSSSVKPHDGGAFEAQSRWNFALLADKSNIAVIHDNTDNNINNVNHSNDNYTVVANTIITMQRT